MAFRGSVEDRLAIRELIEDYADAVNRLDAPDWASSWTDDAQWFIRDDAPQGREAIAALWHQKVAPIAAVRFTASLGAIDVEGEVATARVWVVEDLELAAGRRRLIHGRYDDELVRQEGRWRFRRRRYTFLRES